MVKLTKYRNTMKFDQYYFAQDPIISYQTYSIIGITMKIASKMKPALLPLESDNVSNNEKDKNNIIKMEIYGITSAIKLIIFSFS